MSRGPDLIMAMLVTIVCSAAVTLLFLANAEGRYASMCLAAGYPSMKWPTPLGAVYCVKRVNQTDVVVPLESVRR